METPYDGPTAITELAIGGRAIRLVRPADPDRLLNDPDVLALNRADDYMPYWAYLWPGAYLLAEAVAAEFRAGPVPGEALEIGCGLGLAGLVALACGVPRVHFTDYDRTPLRFVARSAAANGYGPDRFTARRLDWRGLPDEAYPLILGADVLYERRLVPLVANLLDSMLAPSGLALLAGPYRVATEDLEPALGQLGLTVEARPIAAHDEASRPIRGTLHHITRP